MSSSQLTVSGAQVTDVVEVSGLDLEVAIGAPLRALGGTLSPVLLETNRDKLSAYLLRNLRLEQSADKPCAAEMADITPKENHLVAEIRWRCSPSDPVLVVVVRLFQEIDPAAQHMVTASGDVKTFALLSASRKKVSLRAGDAPLGAVIWRYFLAGIEHIAIGYDHIAFLIAVVLWGRRFRTLVAVVTAFTLAHSVILSLAVLDIVQIPSKLVELMIALSIVYVAAENFFVRDTGRRWILTFCFGLIHGFGFASALREYGIPQGKVGWALGAFNVGVEAGQLVIVALAFTALLGADAWSRRHGETGTDQRSRVIVWSVSAGIFLLGLFWAWERTSAWLGR